VKNISYTGGAYKSTAINRAGDQCFEVDRTGDNFVVLFVGDHFVGVFWTGDIFFRFIFCLS